MAKYYNNSTFLMNIIVLLLILEFECILFACGDSPKGLCESSPCQNSASCTDIAVSPYFSCACKSAFNGTRCEGRKFIVNAKCKFHVNDDIRATFTSANSTCVNLGGSLGMMKTPEVQDVVESQVIAQYGATGYMVLWVGGYKSQGAWFWMDRKKIPMSGPNQKWKSSVSDYMIISTWQSTRENMLWYSKKSRTVKGYVCEVAVVDPCGSVNCENGGTCVRTGCQGNCICTPGFYGDRCTNDRITIIPNIGNFIVVQGQSAEVKLKISSNLGQIKIEVWKGAERIKLLRNATASANITIGPLLDQTEDDMYTFRATPELAPGSYYKYAHVTIRVEEARDTETTTEENANENDGSKWPTTYETPGNSQTSFSNFSIATIVASGIGALLLISLISNAVLVVKLRKSRSQPADHAKHTPSVRPYESTCLSEAPYYYDNESNMQNGNESLQNVSDNRAAPTESTTSACEVPRPLNGETNPYEEVKF